MQRKHLLGATYPLPGSEYECSGDDEERKEDTHKNDKQLGAQRHVCTAVYEDGVTRAFRRPKEATIHSRVFRRLCMRVALAAYCLKSALYELKRNVYL